jgi:hypothetical protein
VANDLVTPSDLSDFPGAPYDDTIVDIAVAQLRNEAGWHIAPVRVETIEVYSLGGPHLWLPSLRVLAVTEVRIGDVTYTDGWTEHRSTLHRSGGWAVGIAEVDIEHGYADTPLELLPLVAFYAGNVTDPRDPAVSQRTQTAGPFSETLSYGSSSAATATLTVNPALERYALPTGVA